MTDINMLKQPYIKYCLRQTIPILQKLYVQNLPVNTFYSYFLTYVTNCQHNIIVTYSLFHYYLFNTFHSTMLIAILISLQLQSFLLMPQNLFFSDLYQA